MKRLLIVLLAFSGTAIFAQVPQLVKDVQDTPESSKPGAFAPLGNLLIFRANDGISGNTLWRTNGTAVGTRKIQDNDPVIVYSLTPALTVNNTVFFVSGGELWKSDGTEAGTQQVKEIQAGTSGSITNSSSTEFAGLNGTLYFPANDGVHGEELWKSDGTEGGTVLVKDIRANGDPRIQNFIVSNGLLFFMANDGEHGNELWKTDGTPEGTSLVKDIFPGFSGNSGLSLSGFPAASVSGTLFFAANNGFGSQGIELWRTDGTAPGTVLVKDINPGSGGSSPEGLMDFNDLLYFFALDSLWKSDGTEEGTVAVASVDGAFTNSREAPVQVNDLFFFAARSDAHGVELWKSDGTEAGTVLVKDIMPGSTSSNPRSLIVVNNTLYFTADEGEHGRELWKSDGTEAGTVMVKDVNLGEEDGFPLSAEVFSINDKLFFAATDKENGQELWMSDGTEAGTTLVRNIAPGTIGSVIFDYFTVFQNQLVFTKSTQDAIWKTDGTEAGTTLIKDLIDVHAITTVNENLMLFPARTSETGRELWKSDGTEAGTLPLKDIFPGTESGIDLTLSPWPVYNGKLLFPADDGVHGEELWTSDGTVTGTVMVKDINPGESESLYGPGFSNHNSHVVYKNKLFFRADDGVNGDELWTTDGTEVGTQLLKDINPEGHSGTGFFTEINDVLFFTAQDGTNGRELWKTDGTEAGTVMIKDINPGESSGTPNNLGADYLVNFNGTLFFTANNGATGFELWKSDGTEEGTVLVRDIQFGTEGSNPHNFAVAGNTLFFIADDGEHGRRVWKTDGTDTGTRMVAGAIDFDFAYDLTSVGNIAFFIITTDADGRELWRTDGTDAGTVRITDMIPPVGAREIVTYQNGILYFTANDGEHGVELWTLNALTMEVSVAASSTEICTQDDTITFTASVANTGDNPQYRWFINDVLVENQSTDSLTVDSLSAGDAVKVQVVASQEVWVHNDSLFSASVTIQSVAFTPEITVVGTQLTATEGVSYQWFFNGELLPDTTQTIVATTTGKYQVEVTSEKGCSFLSEEVEVIVCTAEPPTIQVEGFSLTAGAEGTYRWFLDGELLADTTQTIEVTKSGNYQVEVTDAQGCAALSEPVAIDVCSNFTATLTQEGTILTASEGASYQWLLDGDLLPDDTQSIEAEESGTYQVAVTDSLGCTALSEEVEITVTGIEDKILARQLRMYPNPVVSQVYVEAQTHEKVRIFIYNTSGKQVHKGMLIPQSAHHEISLHHLTPGLYLVQFVGEKGTHQRKLMKQ